MQLSRDVRRYAHGVLPRLDCPLQMGLLDREDVERLIFAACLHSAHHALRLLCSGGRSRDLYCVARVKEVLPSVDFVRQAEDLGVGTHGLGKLSGLRHSHHDLQLFS